MANRLIQRHDTAANWSRYNPILAEGELGFVTDQSNRYKIGDGITAWNNLPLQGFNGNVVNELGNDEGSVLSQKFASEKLTELESEVGKNRYYIGSVNSDYDYIGNLMVGYGVNIDGTINTSSGSTRATVIIPISEGTKKITIVTDGIIKSWNFYSGIPDLIKGDNFIEERIVDNFTDIDISTYDNGKYSNARGIALMFDTQDSLPTHIRCLQDGNYVSSISLNSYLSGINTAILKKHNYYESYKFSINSSSLSTMFPLEFGNGSYCITNKSEQEFQVIAKYKSGDNYIIGTVSSNSSVGFVVEEDISGLYFKAARGSVISFSISKKVVIGDISDATFYSGSPIGAVGDKLSNTPHSNRNYVVIDLNGANYIEFESGAFGLRLLNSDDIITYIYDVYESGKMMFYVGDAVKAAVVFLRDDTTPVNVYKLKQYRYKLSDNEGIKAYYDGDKMVLSENINTYIISCEGVEYISALVSDYSSAIASVINFFDEKGNRIVSCGNFQVENERNVRISSIVPFNARYCYISSRNTITPILYTNKNVEPNECRNISMTPLYDSTRILDNGSEWYASGWSAIIPVQGGKTISMIGNYSNNCRYAFLTSNSHVSGSKPLYCNGTTQKTLYPSSIVEDVIPDDCKYLYVTIVSSGGNYIAPTQIRYVDYQDFESYIKRSVYLRNLHKEVSLVNACRSGSVDNENQKDLQLCVTNDTHWFDMAVADAVEITNKFRTVDALLHCGDWQLSTYTVGYMERFLNILDKCNKPWFLTVGNHDVGQSMYIDSCATHEDVYDKYIKPMVMRGILKSGEYTEGYSYYYHDFPVYKKRLIVMYDYDAPLDVLDNEYWEHIDYNANYPQIKLGYTYNFGGEDVCVNCGNFKEYSFRLKKTVTTDSSQYADTPKRPTYKIARGERVLSQRQVQWLINTLKSTPTDYGIIIATHIPASLHFENQPSCKFAQDREYTYGKDAVNTLIGMETDIICDIVNAYINKAQITSKVVIKKSGWSFSDASYLNTLDDGSKKYAYEVSADFSGSKGYFCGFLGGHHHDDFVYRHATYKDQWAIHAVTGNQFYAGGDIGRNLGYNNCATDNTNVISFAKNRIALVRIGNDETKQGQKRDFEVIHPEDE